MLKQKIIFRGSKEDCQAHAKKNNFIFGDDECYYLRPLGDKWIIESEWMEDEIVENRLTAINS